MGKIKYILLVLVILIGNGCIPVVEYHYVIKNTSDSTITVSYKTYYSYADYRHDTTLVLLPDGHGQIMDYVFSGSDPRDEGNNFLSEYDTVVVTTISGRMLKKDPNRRASWTYGHYTYTESLDHTANVYILTIRNSDL